MGSCTTEIYTSPDKHNNKATSDTSIVLAGKGSTREGKTSPRLGNRRSSRIRKRDGSTVSGASEISDCSSSDDSDPNIHLGENILIEAEEKLMMQDEVEMDMNHQRADNHILAVALVTSVMETNTTIPLKLNAVKVEDGPGNGTINNTQNNNEVIDDVKHQATNIKTETDDQEMMDIDKGNDSMNFKQEQINVQHERKLEEQKNLTNVGNINTNNIMTIDTESIVKIAMTKPAKSGASTSSTSSTSSKPTPCRTTRSRAKVVKPPRTMALKGAYASIREAPRGVVRKPNVSIPVPNPILPLPSPLPRQINPAVEKPPSSRVNNFKNVKQEVTSDEKCSVNISMQPLSSSCQIGNTTTQQTMQTETIVKPRTNSVSFNSINHPGHPSNLTNKISRSRIFSIDLDPEGFDFDLSIGVTCNSPAADYADSVSALPPITSSSSNVEKKHAGTGQNQSENEQDASMSYCRNRGMSFELFNFAHGEILPSSDPVDLKEEALNGGRPRGDSIIFDPVSFSDGGIHEENALQRLGHNSVGLEVNEEINLMNTPGFNDASILQPSARRLLPKQVNKMTRGKSNKTTSSNGTNHLPRQTKSNSSSHTTKSKSNSFTVISGNNLQNSEDTIHMPQGSAAAAAAVASMSSQVIPCTVNGTMTSCPVELLNKGGRIGIYLPDARRERISKFHSKRKNRIWRKRIKYDCRKKLADSRPRIKGRFVKSLEE